MLTAQSNASLAQIAELLKSRDNVVICGHVSPDGDCIGSQLALADALHQLGKHAVCVLARDEPVNPALAFLPGVDEMVAASSYDGPCEVFVALDVPVRERLADAAALLDAAGLSITVDHHASDARMTDYAHIDPDSASASILVWELVKLLVENPTPESALCAYTGLATDTGGFRFDNSDARAFCVAAELVGMGVDPAEVAMRVFQNRTLASLKLESLLIERMEVLAGGRAVLGWLYERDLAAIGAGKSDTEPLVDALRKLDTATAACFLRETGGVVRASLRSKRGLDVSALARSHGGGGHLAAAGFTLNMPMDEAVALMRSELEGLVGDLERDGDEAR